MADGNILERQNAKNLNWLHAKIIVTQSWYDSIEILSISHFAIFSNNCHFDWSLLFNFDTTQYMNQFDINSAVSFFYLTFNTKVPLMFLANL